MNILLTTSIIATVYVICVRPLPIYLAQFVLVTLNSCIFIVLALGSAISCIQLMYVANFETTFSMDPEDTGKKIFITLTIVIYIPNLAVGVYDTINNFHIGELIVLFADVEFNGKKFQFFTIHAVFWIFMFLVLNSIAFIFMPLFFKKRLANISSLIPMQTTKYIVRYLIGCLEFAITMCSSVLFSSKKDRKGGTITTNMCAFFFVLLLANHILEGDARRVIKRYISSLLHIEEPTNRERTQAAIENIQYDRASSTNREGILTNCASLAEDQAASSTTMSKCWAPLSSTNIITPAAYMETSFNVPEHCTYEGQANSE
jgi:hypothetical protein